MVLPIDEVRRIADRHGYEEIDHNEISKLLSFRGDSTSNNKNSSTRINVYYTTGTVGTCLNHPHHGKTQLFRRNVVDLTLLSDIFENPRVHTGTGYYRRKHVTQQWKLDSNSSSFNTGNSASFLVDSARRWQYVGYATGLIQNKTEMQIVMDICSKWDSLYWEPNTLADLQQTRYGCGSSCALLNRLYKVFKESFGYVQVVRHTNSMGDIEEAEPPSAGLCEISFLFLDNHIHDVNYIENKFKQLRTDLRFELMNWFLSRDCAGYGFANESGNSKMETSFSSSINAVQFEYGRMMYPKKANLCSHCGVVFNEMPPGVSPPR